MINYTLDIAIMFLAIIIEEDSSYLYYKLKQYEKSIKEKVSIEFLKTLSSINVIFGMNKKAVKNYKQVERRSPKQISLLKIRDFVIINSKKIDLFLKVYLYAN